MGGPTEDYHLLESTHQGIPEGDSSVLSNDPLRIAVVGCGGMASYHLRAYQELASTAPGLVTVSAVCDVDDERARKAAAQIAAFQKETPRIYDNYEKLLTQNRPPAVDLVLPHYLHHTLVAEAFDAGAHVLLEKPLAISIAASQRILDSQQHASGQSPVVLAVAEQYRRTVEARAARWAIQEAGLIGEPRMIFSQRASLQLGLVVGTAWRHDRMMAGGGWVLDGEVHTFDLWHYMFGPIREVYGSLRTFETTRYTNAKTLSGPMPSDVEDTAMAVLTFENGLLANFSWTQAAPGKSFQHRRYYGSDGSLDEQGLHGRDGSTLNTDELQKKFLETLDREQKDALFPFGTRDPVVVELVDFVRAVQNGTNPEVDGLDSLAAMAVSEALYESDYSGLPIKVADVRDGHIRAFQRDIDDHWGLL